MKLLMKLLTLLLCALLVVTIVSCGGEGDTIVVQPPQEPQPVEPVITCDLTVVEDSDGGNEPYLFGTVTYNEIIDGVCAKVSKDDTCDGDTLIEYDGRAQVRVACPDGCRLGACVKLEEVKQKLCNIGNECDGFSPGYEFACRQSGATDEYGSLLCTCEDDCSLRKRANADAFCTGPGQCQNKQKGIEFNCGTRTYVDGERIYVQKCFCDHDCRLISECILDNGCKGYPGNSNFRCNPAGEPQADGQMLCTCFNSCQLDIRNV